MKNSKLIKLLRLFDLQETKQLRKFVSKMNSDETLPKLFEFLVKKAPHFEYKKEQCYQAVYPNKSYSDTSLRKLFAKGIKIVEQFIQWQWIQESDLTKNRALAEFYERKEATTLWEKQIDSWEKANQKSEWDQHFQENLRITQQQFRYRTTLKDKVLQFKNKKNQVETFHNLLTALEQLIIRYSISYKNTSSTIFDRSIRKQEFNFTVLEKIIDLLEKLDEKDICKYQETHPAILASWKTHQLYNSLDHGHFIDLKQLLENDKTIPTLNQVNLTSNLIFYCLDFYEKEGIRPPKEAFFLYKLLLERRLCYKGNYLIPIVYYSLGNIAIVLEEYEWLKWFLDTYTSELPEEEQFHNYNYFFARLAFETNDFYGAIQHFEQLEKANSYIFGFYTKLRLLMSYYEVESDRFETALQSFRVKLSRENKQRIDFKNYKLFINFLYQIYNSPKSNRKKLLVIKEKIEQADFFGPNDWLIHKINEKLGIKR